MRTATTSAATSSRQSVEAVAFLALAGLNHGVRHYWPESVAATVVQVAFLGGMSLAIAIRMRAGYLRRKPHWTRDSWLRYARFAVMPVIAVILVLVFSSLDLSSNASVFGAPGSSMRRLWIVIILGMMLTGVAGLFRAMDWLAQGEPSEQFTRTRWFQRRKG